MHPKQGYRRDDQFAEKAPPLPTRRPKPPKELTRPEAVVEAIPNKAEIDANYGLTEEEAYVMLHSFADSQEGRAVAGKVKTGGSPVEAEREYKKFLDHQIGGFRPEGY